MFTIANADDSVEDSVEERLAPSKVELSESEVAILRAAGLERREGAPGLWLLRNMSRHALLLRNVDRPVAQASAHVRHGSHPVQVPAEGIALEGELKAKAVAIRDELSRHLRDMGTAGLPRKGGEADLRGSWLAGADLSSAQLQDACLEEAQLQGANLVRAQLQGAILQRANLQGADLGGANLMARVLEGGTKQKTILNGAKLQKANFRKAKLEGAILKTAQLQRANFEVANLHRANLSSAQLQHANFTGANLQEAFMIAAKLKNADLTGTNLAHANLKGALESLTNYKPPRPPTALAKHAWRARAVGSLASTAGTRAGEHSWYTSWRAHVYQLLSKDENDDDADSDGEGSGSEDDDAREEPWEDHAALLVAEAVDGLVTIAQPVLALIEPTIAELERMCDELSKGVPFAAGLVSMVPKRRSSQEQQRLRRQQSSSALRTLLSACFVDLVFDEALPRMVLALLTQLEKVSGCLKGTEELDVRTIRDELLTSLRSIREELQKAQKVRFEATCIFPVRHFPRSSSPNTRRLQEQFSELPTIAESTLPEARRVKALDNQARAFAAEVLSTLTESLLVPLQERDRLKQSAEARLETFIEQASGPIAAALATREADQAASRLPELIGFLGTLKDALCRDNLRKRVSQHLVRGLPTEHLGYGAAQKLAIAGMFETQISEKLAKLGDSVKLLKRHLPIDGIRGRAFEAILKASTKYEVRVGGVEGSCDMLKMAWQRSRVELNTDENELQYLQEELVKLKEKELTSINWRDTAEGWISVLDLRGQLKVECGQAVLECMCSDTKVLEALGAAKALMAMEGDNPPAALVTIIARGPGVHIRKHGYRYTKRLNKELVLIRRVKELQGRAVAGIVTLLVATSVTWAAALLTLLVLVGLLTLGLLLFGLWQCYKNARPVGKGGAKTVGARVAPLDVTLRSRYSPW